MTRIALIQTTSSQDQAEALTHTAALIAEAAQNGAQLVCLQELFLHSYFCQYPAQTDALALAQPVPSEITNHLSALARQHRIVLIAGTVYEYDETTDTRFNTALVFESDGRMLGTYRKTHIPNDRCYHEADYFAAGDSGVKVFATSVGRLAVLICYDQWFPELARIAALQGAEIIVYPSAIGDFLDEVPEEGEWQTKWETIQVSHAIANNVFVAAINRVGIEGNLAFWGGSFVADSWGTVIARAGTREQILYADCDLTAVRKVQELWGFFANRRPEIYSQLLQLSNPVSQTSKERA